MEINFVEILHGTQIFFKIGPSLNSKMSKIGDKVTFKTRKCLMLEKLTHKRGKHARMRGHLNPSWSITSSFQFHAHWQCDRLFIIIIHTFMIWYQHTEKYIMKKEYKEGIHRFCVGRRLCREKGWWNINSLWFFMHYYDAQHVSNTFWYYKTKTKSYEDQKKQEVRFMQNKFPKLFNIHSPSLICTRFRYSLLCDTFFR